MRTHAVLLAVPLALISLAAACSGGKDSVSPNTPTPTLIELSPAEGPIELDAIGATAQLGAKIKDEKGAVMANLAVKYESSNSAIVSVSPTGLVTANSNGTAGVTAWASGLEARISVHVAQKMHGMVAASGDKQSATTGEPLGEPIVVRVVDRLNKPVAGVAVAFGTASGNGTVSPPSDTTGQDGLAETAWTAGASIGVQRATVFVEGFDTLYFTASVDPPPLAISPDTLVEGGQATISNGSFNATASSNSVKVDGVSAQVLSATATSITFKVPSYACAPPRVANVEIISAGLPNTSGTVPIRPPTLTSLAVGEQLIVQDPTKFCFQFAAGKSNTAERYLMGFSMPAELPGAVVPFRIVGRSGAPAPLASNAPLTSAGKTTAPQRTLSSLLGTANAPGVRGFAPPTNRLEEAGHMRAEMNLRAWEAEHLPAFAERYRQRIGASSSYRVARSVGPAIQVGDIVTIRVPTWGANTCTSYTTIQATVRVIGTHGIWVTDAGNPTEDPLSVTDIQNASNQFDDYIYASDVKYFGAPSDIDGNGRVVIVLTKEVNRSPGLGGFVTGADLFPGDPSCPASNGGEIYYSYVPDPNNTLAGGPRTKQAVLLNMKRLIAHEVTHVIQLSRRYILANGSAMHSWEMEGQATLAEELAGEEVNGYAQGQNFGSNYIFGTDNYYWFASGPLKLMDYMGSGIQNASIPDAPDLCSVYASHSLATPCDEWAYYGASWALQRYILDQYGPSYPGGITQLTKDWISKYPTQVGTYNVAAVLGVDYDRLFVHFATAIALDDLLNATGKGWVPGEFSFTSWNLQSIASYMQQCCSRPWLEPPVMTYDGDAALDRSVRGGSTAYTAIEPGTAEGGASFRVVDRSGNTMSTSYKPLLWVVRIQ